MTAAGSDTAMFVDSNIWIYAFIFDDRTREKHNAASALVSKSNIAVSAQVINEVCLNLQKGKFAERQIPGVIKAFFERCKVVQFDEQILLKASALRENNTFSFWDSLIVASALASGCEVLYSEDMQDGMLVDGKMRILNPLKN